MKKNIKLSERSGLSHWFKAFAMVAGLILFGVLLMLLTVVPCILISIGNKLKFIGTQFEKRVKPGQVLWFLILFIWLWNVAVSVYLYVIFKGL